MGGATPLDARGPAPYRPAYATRSTQSRPAGPAASYRPGVLRDIGDSRVRAPLPSLPSFITVRLQGLPFRPNGS